MSQSDTNAFHGQALCTTTLPATFLPLTAASASSMMFPQPATTPVSVSLVTTDAPVPLPPTPLSKESQNIVNPLQASSEAGRHVLYAAQDQRIDGGALTTALSIPSKNNSSSSSSSSSASNNTHASTDMITTTTTTVASGPNTCTASTFAASCFAASTSAATVSMPAVAAASTYAATVSMASTAPTATIAACTTSNVTNATAASTSAMATTSNASNVTAALITPDKSNASNTPSSLPSTIVGDSHDLLQSETHLPMFDLFDFDYFNTATYTLNTSKNALHDNPLMTPRPPVLTPRV
jgi:hypothetical protein